MRSIHSAGVFLALSICGVAASAPQSAPGQPRVGSLAAATGVGTRSLMGAFYEASVRASRAAGHLVSFETHTDARAATAAAFAAAARAASEAIEGVAGQPGGKCVMARVSGVAIEEGVAPAATLAAGVLTVVVAPGRAGTPSAMLIERAVRTAAVSCV
jgi:hypothetical protein